MSDDSIIAIPLRNLIAIIFAVAVAVVGYFEVTNRISMAERELALMKLIEATGLFSNLAKVTKT